MSTDSTALAKASQQDILVASGFDDDSIALQPTNVIITQRTTRNTDAVPGKIFDELTGTNFDKIKVVPLAVTKGRVLFPEGGDLTAGPLCRSDNGVVPSPKAPYPQAATCAACSHSSWDAYVQKTGRGKPDCQASFRLLFILQEFGLPRRMKFSGTSYKPFVNLVQNLKQQLEGAKYRGEILNLFDFSFTISSTPVEGPKGSYFVAKFSNVARVTNPDEFGALFEKYVLAVKARQQSQDDSNNDPVEEVTSEITI